MAGTLFTIDADISFVEALAEGVLSRYGQAPEALAAVTILLPNRRSTRALQDAFLQAGKGKALLLPMMQGIGDVEEDELSIGLMAAEEEAWKLPPVMPAIRRRLLLAQLIEAWAAKQPRDSSHNHLGANQAVQLAVELSRLLDDIQREGLSFGELKNIVPEDLAKHWQVTMEFLDIVGKEWPRILEREGALDAVERRNRLLFLQAKAWQKNPPPGPVIAAGTTGSMPATQTLLKAVAGLEQGMIVLPGLALDMPQKEWDALPESHPQFGMKTLLQKLEFKRADVRPWQAPGRQTERKALLAEVMRPAGESHRWGESPIDSKAIQGLKVLEAPDQHTEALAIALAMREVLESDRQKACLITYDRMLAERVAAFMKRWGVEVNDSAGQPLAHTPPLVFLRLITSMIASRFSPAEMLACLKHPLASGGMKTRDFRKKVRQVERMALRGVRPEGIQAIKTMVQGKDRELHAWLSRLEEMLEPLAQLYRKRNKVDLCVLVEAHIQVAEALAATGEGDGQLWSADQGDEAAAFMEEVRTVGNGYTLLPEDYLEVMDGLLTGRSFRPRYGLHPRLAILSPAEARLQHWDRMILGGMNQGSWPPEAVNPWLSRGMGKDFGLPGEARLRMLSSHDLSMFACGPDVLVTRAARSEGAPTVPSPFLLRLLAVLEGRGLNAKVKETPWLSLIKGLATQAGHFPPLQPPSPTPPAHARPQQLAVTDIERLMRDPYAVYARKVLRLKPMDPIDQDPGAAEFGNCIHKAFELFIRQKGYRLPRPEAEALMERCGHEAFTILDEKPAAKALWWPRFAAVAAWFLDKEAERWNPKREIWPEMQGSWEVPISPPFTLTAKADRLEVLEGGLSIIDYKTGTLPTETDAVRGFSPQLILEALIALEGGFDALPPVAHISLLAYWKTGTGAELGTTKEVDMVLDETKEGFLKLLEFFRNPQTPYLACPDPTKAPKNNDFKHLERMKEWL
jgi:ATP-dependent helicase/nuclease subunit B